MYKQETNHKKKAVLDALIGGNTLDGWVDTSNPVDDFIDEVVERIHDMVDESELENWPSLEYQLRSHLDNEAFRGEDSVNELAGELIAIYNLKTKQ